MTPTQREFLSRVDAAIEEFVFQGKTASEVAARYGISKPTIRRHMRKRGLSLSEEEIRARQSKSGKVKQSSPRFRSQPCPPGCQCKRHTKPTNVVLGRKHCTKCKRWRLLCDFDARERDVEGNALAWQAHCKPCVRERCRVHRGIQRRGKPYERRDVRKRMTGEELKAHRRKLHAERMKDPKYREDRREYARIYAEVKRREAGIEPRFAVIQNRDVPGGERGEKLHAEPMIHWVRKNINRYEGDNRSMANACGVDETTIRNLRNGSVTRISESLADRILTNEGSTDLWECYPHLYAL